MATAVKSGNDLMIYNGGAAVYEISLKTVRKALTGVLTVVQSKHWYTPNLDAQIIKIAGK